MFFDYYNIDFNARLSLLKQYAIFENSVIIKINKTLFFLEKQVYDRKESSVIKYSRIRSKLTVFLKVSYVLH